jgi:hypothetical protein
MRGQSRWVGILIGGALGALVACEPEDPSCISSLGIDITNIVVKSYNDVVRNSPSGSGSWTYNCNMGGSADITGTVNTSTVTFDLTYTFHACMHQDGGDVITLDGVLHDSTQNGGSTSSRTETATSDALTIKGDVILCNADPIDATCEVDIFYSGSTTLVTICGLSYP